MSRKQVVAPPKTKTELLIDTVFNFMTDNPSYIFKGFGDADKFEITKKKFAKVLESLVESRHLVRISVDDSGEPWYFSNGYNHYSPNFLFEVIPAGVRDDILRPLERGDEKSISDLARNYFGSETVGLNFIETTLEYFVSRKLIGSSGRKALRLYKKTQLGLELGIDKQSMDTMANRELESTLLLQRKGEVLSKINSLEDIDKLLDEELESIIVGNIDVTSSTDGDFFNVVFLNEILFGNKFTDTDILNWALERVNPNLTVASGLIQGNFLGVKMDKARILAENSGLNEIDAQFRAAKLLNEKLEQVTKGQVFNVLGDDDWDLADSYAQLMHRAEGGIISYGFNSKSLSDELKRRLDMLAYRRKRRIQYEIITPYQLRVGRSLLNRDEVWEATANGDDSKDRVYKGEYRLIIEILVAKKVGIDYPKSYDKVVDIGSLFDGDMSKKRIITPNSLFLKAGDRTIRFTHNPSFSNITQYWNTIDVLNRIMRSLGARKTEEIPFVVAEGHQERFFATFIPSGLNDKTDDGHWFMNLPGLQNPILQAKGRIPEFDSRILSSKSHRQITFRKEPVTPGVLDFGVHMDGRVQFRILNHMVKNVIERSAGMPEEVHRVAFLTDLQFASLTMHPELVMKFLDYALFTLGCDAVMIGGDVIQGINYPQTFSENRPFRLVSIDSQQRFVLATLFPFLATGPKLKKVLGVIGNHEWNTFGANLTGPNFLAFLEQVLQGYVLGMKTAGGTPTLEDIAIVSRIRMLSVEAKQGGAIVNWPFISQEFSGFKVAMSHQFQRFGGGTPVGQQMKWIENMSTAASDYDVLVGGDKHSIWMAQVADKLLLQLAAAAHQSGYELHTGLRSTIMFTDITFSNKDGITVEMVPRGFLENYYTCVSPILAGKDELLKLPAPGTPGYDQGKLSPYVESIIDNITQYRHV